LYAGSRFGLGGTGGIGQLGSRFAGSIRLAGIVRLRRIRLRLLITS
jgi:hypothetical protein